MVHFALLEIKKEKALLNYFGTCRAFLIKNEKHFLL